MELLQRSGARHAKLAADLQLGEANVALSFAFAEKTLQRQVPRAWLGTHLLLDFQPEINREPCADPKIHREPGGGQDSSCCSSDSSGE